MRERHGCYRRIPGAETGLHWSATSPGTNNTVGSNRFWIRVISDVNLMASPWEYFLGFYRVYHVAGKQYEDMIVSHLAKSMLPKTGFFAPP